MAHRAAGTDGGRPGLAATEGMTTARRSFDARLFVARYGTALGGLAVFLFFVAAAPNFSNAANLVNILKQVSFLVIFGVGFTLALTTSELDLSFANLASLAAVATGGLVHTGAPIPLAVAAGISIGLVGGLANGLAVTVIKVPSLIATLGTASIANGFAFWMTEGVAFVGRWDPSFVGIGRGATFGVPNLILWSAAAALLALFLLKKTRTGIHMVATGEADEAARLSGIAVRRMKVIGLTLSGLAAGVAAVLLTANLSSAAPTMAGDYLLNAIAAVLLGMTMFEPGRPNIPGTVTGALVIGMLSNGLILMGAAYYVQDIVLGVIIILSVAVSASALKKAAFAV